MPTATKFFTTPLPSFKQLGVWLRPVLNVLVFQPGLLSSFLYPTSLLSSFGLWFALLSALTARYPCSMLWFCFLIVMSHFLDDPTVLLLLPLLLGRSNTALHWEGHPEKFWLRYIPPLHFHHLLSSCVWTGFRFVPFVHAFCFLAMVSIDVLDVGFNHTATSRSKLIPDSYFIFSHPSCSSVS